MPVVKPFILAVQFLTLIPLRLRQETCEKDFQQSLYFFPWVGLGIGALLVAADTLLAFIFPPLISSVLLVSLWIFISGGLHMDGLADTADGFLSARPKEKILAIMRDSRIGAMGAIALVLVILLKILAVYSLPFLFRWQFLLLAPAAGRCAFSIPLTLFSYARENEGLAAPFSQNRSWKLPVFSFTVLFLASAILSGWTGAVAASVVVAFVLIFSSYASKKIGGYTGDTLGATCEWTEILFILTAVSLKHMDLV